MLIRQETPADYTAVYALVKDAFAQAEHSDGNEHNLVEALRGSSAFVPELSLVAESDGAIIGHILFTKIDIGGCTALALAPLAVHPVRQRQGIGTALIAQGHRIARELGYDYVVVLGSAAYYPRSGYRLARPLGIEPPFDVPDENFMAIRLREDVAPLCGMVKYADEFGI